jgi:hypothetical protein
MQEVTNMTTETMHKILDLYDRAKDDPEYMALYAEYAPSQAAFIDFWGRLSEDKQQLVSNYLETSAALHHRLLEMAMSTASSNT